MVMDHWEYARFQAGDARAARELDMRVVRWLLWMMPLIEPNEMASVTGLGANWFYQLLSALREEGLVVRASMGRALGKRYRYWLTTKGVCRVAAETGSPIAWQVTEAGVGWLMRQLPMVEQFYALAPTLMSCAGVTAERATWEEIYAGRDVRDFTPDLQMREFSWCGKGVIHAVATYENDAWFPLVWVGSMATEHQLREKAKSAMRQLHGGSKPAGWVTVGFDRLAAKLAAEVWPADNVLAVATDGHVERAMRPGSCTPPPSAAVAPQRLGRPDNLTNWWNMRSKQYRPELAALNGPMAYAIFRFIAEWCGATPAQLERRFGPSSRAAVRALRKAGLVAKLGGKFYLDWPGLPHGGSDGPCVTPVGAGSAGSLSEAGRCLPPSATASQRRASGRRSKVFGRGGASLRRMARAPHCQ